VCSGGTSAGVGGQCEQRLQRQKQEKQQPTNTTTTNTTTTTPPTQLMPPLPINKQAEVLSMLQSLIDAGYELSDGPVSEEIKLYAYQELRTGNGEKKLPATFEEAMTDPAVRREREKERDHGLFLNKNIQVHTFKKKSRRHYE
jgi:hypothetical protein